jgi:carboxypeptidase C (cathepsin A)
VHMPASILADVGGFPINTYFLYFEARHNASSAPLAIYLAGGPGEASAYSAFSSETGPCYVNEAGNDTIPNPWSFNDRVNMLYIDQPVQSGFSYTSLVNGSYDLQTGLVTPILAGSTPPQANETIAIGTFPSQDPFMTTNTTVSASRAVWHFAEHFFSSFPGYTTSSKKISIWGNSYGGLWAPEVATQLSKNFKKLPPHHPLTKRNLTIDTIGITDGFIDLAYVAEGYPQFAWNNTYGNHYATKDQYNQAVDNITMSGGLNDMIKECRALVKTSDPLSLAINQTVNEVCSAAEGTAFEILSAFPSLNEVCANPTSPSPTPL